MRPHEGLDVWRKAIEFVIAIYRATDIFPNEEKFGLTSQLRRAAVSIPANIARVREENHPRSLHTSCRPLRVRQARWIPRC